MASICDALSNAHPSFDLYKLGRPKVTAETPLDPADDLSTPDSDLAASTLEHTVGGIERSRAFGLLVAQRSCQL